VLRPQPEHNPGTAHVDIEDMIRQTFGAWDSIAEEVAAAEEALQVEQQNYGWENVDYDDEECDWMDEEDIPWGDPDAMERVAAEEDGRIQEAARILLFQGSTVTVMEITTILLNILREGGASNVLIIQAFAALHRIVLPQPNTLPDSKYEASSVLRRPGLSFQSIYACPNGCVFFRGVYKDAMLCPHYSSMRMSKRGNSMVPQKFLRFFPLIPYLKRMFRSPLQAAAMTWHSRINPLDKLIQHASQAKAWAHINESLVFENFGDDPRNLWLGLATDGINPFSEKRSVHSC
jgi:hypothetical protein